MYGRMGRRTHGRGTGRGLFGLLAHAALAALTVACAAGPAAPPAQNRAAALAASAVAANGTDRGLCAVLGADADLLAHLVVSTKFLVHVREPDQAKVAELRTLAEQVNVGIDRLVLERGPTDKLPYADNLVDVVMATQLSADSLTALPVGELLRVLRPEGAAVVGTPRQDALDTKTLRAWAEAGGAENVKVWQGALGAWAVCTKPRPAGMDDWSHWEHGPDNNPVSSDTVIKAPYMTQFLAEPYHVTMPAITTIAGGRTFLATGHIAHHRREWDIVNKLIVRNGYNGVVLWQRDLPDGFLAHRSAYVATADTFYLMEGDGCLMLDPGTGEEKGRLRVPDVAGEWKWMAMQDDVWYVLAGRAGGRAKVIKGDRNFGGWGWGDLSEGYYGRPRVPWGFGQTLAAYQPGTSSVLWQHTEETPIDSRALAMRDGKLFLYCPGAHLRCLDVGTGEVLWTNSDKRTLELIEQPGRRLTSTPGFRSACIAVATPGALIVQGQTRMNVVAVSTSTGELLWQKPKVSNNPNVIFIDGGIVLGVGRGSNHVLVDPVSGAVLEELGFRKAACTRLTASTDSLFVRGEGTLRYDRASKRVLIDGAARPGCNDGALPANGLLYLGPWACDCNLQLIGAMAKCSAGDFQFDRAATDAERLQTGDGDIASIAPLETTEADWPTYRRDNDRSSSTSARLARPNAPKDTPAAPAWRFAPPKPYVPTPAVTVGDSVWVAGSDGVVRAVHARNGQLLWAYATGGAIKAPPTVWEGRVYAGSGDGHVYCLEAGTGRLLWRFRAAPVERYIMVYGNLCSTWPVNTGVLVHDGVAYFGAGIVDQDGTYVYALDARTGAIKWQNNTCGHLNPELRKGVSAQGYLTVLGDQLYMAGGNQVNPARFSLATGECLNQPFNQGQPKANHGKFAGVLFGKYPIVGGRTLYAWAENVANKDSFAVQTPKGFPKLNFGGIPPAWSDDTFALVNFRDGKLTCCDAAKVTERVEAGLPPPERPGMRRHWFGVANALQGDGAVRWTSDLGQPDKFEVVSLVVCPTAVVAVVKYQTRNRAHPQWFLAALDSQNGTPWWFWRRQLSSKPLPEGLLVGRYGQVVVTMLDGSVQSFAPQRPRPRADAAPRAPDRPRPRTDAAPRAPKR